MENTKSTDLGGDLLLTNKPQTVSRRTERMPQRKKEEQVNFCVSMKESKTRRKNEAMAWIGFKKTNDMVS